MDIESFMKGLRVGLALGRPPKSEYWCRMDALVYAANTILSENNGSRTPYVKIYDGEAAAFLAFNDSGNQFNGNWMHVYLVAPVEHGIDAVRVRAGNNEASPGTFTYNGREYYVGGYATSPTWGGSTTYTNPLNLPTITDVTLITGNINSGWAAMSPDFGTIVGELLQLR